MNNNLTLGFSAVIYTCFLLYFLTFDIYSQVGQVIVLLASLYVFFDLWGEIKDSKQ